MRFVILPFKLLHSIHMKIPYTTKKKTLIFAFLGLCLFITSERSFTNELNNKDPI